MSVTPRTITLIIQNPIMRMKRSRWEAPRSRERRVAVSATSGCCSFVVAESVTATSDALVGGASVAPLSIKGAAGCVAAGCVAAGWGDWLGSCTAC